MNIGIITELHATDNCFRRVSELGLDVCQLCGWDMSLATREMAERVLREAEEQNVRICAFWAGVPGRLVWDFAEGPTTLGIVPEAVRAERVAALKRWADFANWIGVPAIITHCGFIPENMTDPQYEEVVAAIREVAQYCAQLGLEFWFETGQETPVVLLRTIDRVGTGNLGVNLDPANLIMYGKGNPVDALGVIGKYVRNIHVKDGMYPTSGDALGAEVAPGQGQVDFPQFLSGLKQLGFKGEFIIEREITGEQQKADIRQTITDLQQWWAM
ncbi:sugar phosphate isomerase/epimerase family protein [Paenibacillus agaridevorans]|uniref:sugar phosphate isomerase/epimerase family protein n=1 Tax=Paenibacillus agaridevorans TaxID=171404 RepID=UPI001BE4B222|nr:sugar phosphate isomerase/epimerase family protein [Paenibacillus agaridevorans]